MRRRIYNDDRINYVVDAQFDHAGSTAKFHELINFIFSDA